MFELLLQQIANGLSSGMAYALLALGLTLVFGVLHVVNFAHGELYMAGGFVCAILTNFYGVPYALTFPLAVGLAVAIAYLVDLVAVKPVMKQKDGEAIVLVATFATGILIHQAVLAYIGPAPIRANGLEGVLRLGPVALTHQRLFVLVAGIVLILLLEIILNRSRFGKSLRAVAQSAFAARVVGLDVDRIKTATFLLAAAFSGLAGTLIAPVITFNANMGQNAVITAFVIVVAGSMGSISGAVVCGLALGVIEAVASIFLPQEIASAIIYSFLLVMLLVRPQGLFSVTK
ncbi:branched-chain amino acid transport system permease protein [Neorhizobium galegae]|uniref:branched-chain amino acid ABC transporter permease n=1 Tax=Neorhizobium galegae TaxID=399 RepID=UPI002783A6FC|nr:branched-chain amino acid ABC transporter permease [Neorhizobium galegae]MDQ0137734.1 branched-chain amino acid transport system permease protein [Neorhizobium galegae]